MTAGPSQAAAAAAARLPQTPPRESQLDLFLQEWRQGWRPGVAAIVGVSLGYTLWLVLSSLFVEPLQREFGWSRGEIALAHSAGMVTGLIAPLIGRLVDRVGVKPVVITGLTVSALCYLALAQMNGSLTFYYVTYVFLIVSGMATTGITYGKIVVGTFKRSRGASLALLRVGVGFSQAVLPLLAFPILVRFGSTGGFLTLSAINALVTLPLVLLLVPGKAAPASTGGSTTGQQKPTRWQLLARQPKILVLSMAAMLHTAPITAIMTQLKPLGVSLGLTPAAAAGAVSVIAGTSVVGAVVSGVLVDRIWAPAVAVAMCMLPMAGCLMFILMSNGVPVSLFYLSAILIGFGMGGESDVLGYIVARYFGVHDFSTIAGVAALCVTLGIAAAASLIGYAYDVFGSYRIALLAASASLVFAGIAFLAMGRYPVSSTR